jgi:carboxymethylenebutenolidase
MLEDFIAAYDYLKSHKDCNGQVGCGILFWRLDCQYDGGKVPTLAAVPYYGGQPTEAEQITTPLLHYAGLDSRVNEGWPAYEAILRKNNIENTAFIYPGQSWFS